MAIRGILTHRKTRRLARLLDVDLPTAVGYLEALWHVTAEQAPRGDIGRLSNEDITDEMFSTRDPEALVGSLIEAGWIDRDPDHRLVIHDWSTWADDNVRGRIYRWKTTFCDGQPPWNRKKTGGESDTSPKEETTEIHFSKVKNDQISLRQSEKVPKSTSAKSLTRGRVPEPEPEPEPEPVSPPTPSCGGDADEPTVGEGGAVGVIDSTTLAELEREEADLEKALREMGMTEDEIATDMAALRQRRPQRARWCGKVPTPTPSDSNATTGLVAPIRDILIAFRPDWPPPDAKTIRRVERVIHGADPAEVHRHLEELHRKGLRPDVSWDWFAGVLAKRFGTGSAN